jgi:hypothetical protein
VKHDGPALFAHVGSGCESYELIAYKNSGMLAEGNPEFVDAVVVASCGNDTRTTVVRLGREWHETGYMSVPLSIYSLMPSGCDSNPNVGVAFSANGKWDSKYGQNYDAKAYSGNEVIFKTNQNGNGYINDASWNFIIGEMRK